PDYGSRYDAGDGEKVGKRVDIFVNDGLLGGLDFWGAEGGGCSEKAEGRRGGSVDVSFLLLLPSTKVCYSFSGHIRTGILGAFLQLNPPRRIPEQTGPTCRAAPLPLPPPPAIIPPRS